MDGMMDDSFPHFFIFYPYNIIGIPFVVLSTSGAYDVYTELILY